MTKWEKASVLSEALPYIQRYNKKTIVIKYGGNAMQTDELKRSVISDIVLLSLVGMRVVVVHGGGPEINAVLNKMRIEPRFVNGLRYTDGDTMDVVQMVLSGKIGKDLVSLITSMGGQAISLSGIDGKMIACAPMGQEYGLVGEIKAIDPKPVTMALDNGYIPVVSTVGQGPDSAFNINADTVAGELAVALGAEKLFLLTDVPGLCLDPQNPETLFPVIELSEVPGLVKKGVISGGMIPKLDCCVNAVRRGVGSAVILDGRTEHSILMELLSDSGVGTMIVNSAGRQRDAAPTQ